MKDEFVAKVQVLNRIVIPKELTEIEGIKEGDYLKLKIIKVIKK